MERQIKLIQTLSDARGVSGFEDEVVSLSKSHISSAYTCKEDHLRNVYIQSNTNIGRRASVLLDAHSDEVGFIVQAIKPNGTLVFLPLGGWVENTLPASKVYVRDANGKYIPGIIAAKPPHFIANKAEGNATKMSEMVIDIGARSKEEAIQLFQIEIGAPVVPAVECTYDEEKDLFLGKAFDCRIGVAALLETLHQLEKEETSVDVLATLSAQEEVGERGMNLIAKTISPSIAIVFEGCPADDTFQESWMVQTALRKGPMLRHFDRGMITNPRFQKFALQAAKKHDIPVQESVRSGGGTNGAMLHLANGGTPCIVIGIPVRYIHSHHGFTTLADFQHSVNLAVALVKELTPEIIETF